LTIIVVYALTEELTDAERDEFYSALEDIPRSVQPHDQLIPAGDLNADSGVDRLGFDKVVGPYGSGTPNNNPIRLLPFCSTLGLTLVGSWYPRPDIRRWTWISNDGVTKKEIDHILTKRREDFTSYRVFKGAECPANTDHRLIIANCKMELVRSKQKIDIKRSFNVESLRSDSSLRDRYALEVQKGFNALDNLTNDVKLL